MILEYREIKFEIYKGFIVVRIPIKTGGVLSQAFVDFIYNAGSELNVERSFMDLYHFGCYWMILE